MDLIKKNVSKVGWGAYILFLVLLISIPASSRLVKLNSSFHNSSHAYNFYILLLLDLAIILVPIGFMVLMARKGNAITAARTNEGDIADKLKGSSLPNANSTTSTTMTKKPPQPTNRAVSASARRRKNRRKR